MATVYLVAMFFFGSILISSWVSGEITEGVGEALEGIGDAVESVLESLPGIGDVELTGDIQWGGPGTFRSLLAFGTFFGGGGYIALNWFHVTEAISIIVAFGFGGVGFLISFLFFRFMAKQEVTSSVPQSAYIGLRGAVTVSLLPNSLGSINVTGPLGIEILLARSNEPIAVGVLVKIVSIEGGIAYVEPNSIG